MKVIDRAVSPTFGGSRSAEYERCDLSRREVSHPFTDADVNWHRLSIIEKVELQA